MTNVGSGAKAEAERLVASASAVISEIAGDGAAPSEHKNRIGRLIDHGISRRVDSQIRQRSKPGSAWAGLEATAVEALAEAEPNLLVMIGSHPSGYVRQEAARLALPIVDAGDPRPGIARLLSQRALDAIPSVREVARAGVEAMFAAELARTDEGWMPRGTERGAREIVEQVRCVELCPELVDTALDLFASRTGRYALSKGVFDHHRHNRKEVDRRAQLLADLQKISSDLDPGPQQAAAHRLIDFYEASLTPVRA